MPGSSAPVQLARLPSLTDGAFRAFVRFPVLVLEGDLRMNGVTWETLDLENRAWRTDAPHEPAADPTAALLLRVW